MMMSIRKQQEDYDHMSTKEKVLYQSPRLIALSLSWFSLLHVANLFAYGVCWILKFIAFCHLPNNTNSIDRYIDLRTPGHYFRIFNLMNALTLVLFLVEGLKFISYKGVSGSTRRLMLNAAGNIATLVTFAFMVSCAHMIAFGFRLKSFRNYRTSLFSTVNLFNVRKNFQQFYDVYTCGPAMYLIFLVLLCFIIGHLVLTLWDFFKKGQRDFLSAIASHIDKAQEHTLSSVESNMVRPMQEALSKMRTQIEVLQDKEGQNFLKRGNT
jgi:hypothetical protein